MDAYTEELFESENLRTPTKRMHTILDSKYGNIDLKELMKYQ